MRMRVIAVAAAAITAMAAAACGSGGPAASPTATATAPATTEPTQVTSTATPGPQNFTVAFSEKERVESPDVPAADIEELTSGNNRFALDLYGRLAEEDGNLFMSPYSISLALAMTYAGAEGQTADEMAEALGFTLSPERLHAAFNALDQALAERGADLEPDEKFTLEIANSLWGQQGFQFEQPFLDTLAENYGAGMRLVDYAGAVEDARQAINGWVEENTNGRIEDLIAPGVLRPDTVLVLANAIYFKAAWAREFNPELTEQGDFHLLDGSAVTADMMRQEARFSMADGEGYRAVELPYVGFDTSMVVIMPDEGEFERFEASLDSERLDEIIGGMGSKNIDLQFPKFTFESKFALPAPLKELGMRQAFEPGVADFSGMRTPPPELFISDVIHQSFVSVDEEGTEAAAATAVIMEPTSAPPPPEPLVLDRPFIFLIRDVQTGQVLFLGRLLDPTVG